MATTMYSIDTSCLVHGWHRAYPPKRFPGLWARIDELIEAGRLVASIEVFSEIEKKDDELCAWAKERKNELFRDIDDGVQDAVVHVMATYPKLVDTAKGRSGGDPFVYRPGLSNRSSFDRAYPRAGWHCRQAQKSLSYASRRVSHA